MTFAVKFVAKIMSQNIRQSVLKVKFRCKQPANLLLWLLVPVRVSLPHTDRADGEARIFHEPYWFDVHLGKRHRTYGNFQHRLITLIKLLELAYRKLCDQLGTNRTSKRRLNCIAIRNAAMGINIASALSQVFLLEWL
jgi:hypothetical protein